MMARVTMATALTVTALLVLPRASLLAASPSTTLLNSPAPPPFSKRARIGFNLNLNLPGPMILDIRVQSRGLSMKPILSPMKITLEKGSSKWERRVKRLKRSQKVREGVHTKSTKAITGDQRYDTFHQSTYHSDGTQHSHNRSYQNGYYNHTHHYHHLNNSLDLYYEDDDKTPLNVSDWDYDNNGHVHSNHSMSEWDYDVNPMFLCSQPPLEFSHDFDGNTKEECENTPSTTSLSFHTTLEICDQIYSRLPKRVVEFYGLMMETDEEYLVYMQPEYVQLCVPLHQRFDECEDNGFVTFCSPTGVTFVNPTTCPFYYNSDASSLVLLFDNIFADDECIREICTGIITRFELRLNGILAVILKLPLHDSQRTKCRRRIVRIVRAKDIETNHITINTHWPSCYTMHLISWSANPEVHGLKGGWSYLPWNCMFVEVILISVVGCVALVGIVGNMLVLVVMMQQKKLRESCLLRTSLAVSNLLTDIFIVVPSFYYHLVPILYPPAYRTGSNENTYIVEHSTLVINGSLPLLQAMLLTVCTLVSFFTLFLLSVERFVLCGRALKYSDYCSVCTVKVTIALTWFLAALDTLLFTYSEITGWFTTEWQTFMKLPSGVNYYYNTKSHWLALRVTSYFTFLVVFFTILFSVLAIVRFLLQQRNARSEWRLYEMRVSRSVMKEELYILSGLALMTFLFILSVLPITVVIVCNFFQQDIPIICNYVGEWTLIASTAWNPWLYNFWDTQFKKDVKRLTHWCW